MPGPNLSFETPDVVQGEADGWDVSVASTEEAIATFGDSGLVWDPAESFERLWRLPYFVHSEADSINVVTGSDATDEPSALALVGDIVLAYRAHLLTTNAVHFSADLDWIAYFARPETLAAAIVEANAIKYQLYHEGDGKYPQGHLSNWPLVHRREDIQSRVAAPDAYDLPTLITLANAVKIQFNGHLALVEYGDYNDAGRFVFAIGDLQAFTIRDQQFESFERGFAVPDMVPAIIAAETDMVSPGPPNRWGSFLWGLGRWGGPPAWPSGQEQFLNSFDMVAGELGLLETFERGWLLPGALGNKGNEKFLKRFYDSVLKVWRFTAGQLYLSLLESFESGWKHNEDGKDAYWDGTEWRFQSWQLERGMNMPESFETGWTLVLSA